MTRLTNIAAGLPLVALAVALAGGSGSRGTQRTPPPPWMTERPLSGTHYIGIGSAAQTAVPGEGLKNAKKQAAADLAAEIAVRVESASILESAERNGTLQEQFSSTISSRAEERISGFEVAGVWEGQGMVHVYYRLNKAKHAAERRMRRESAIEAAIGECVAGKAALEQGLLSVALSRYDHGIMALEEFWNEVNRGTVDGSEVTLESHMVIAIRNAIQSTEITPAVETVILDAAGSFKFPLGLHATVNGTSATGVPLNYRYHNGTYRKSGTEFTDGEGMVVALISNVRDPRPDESMEVGVDLERLFKQAEMDAAVLELIGNPVVPTLAIPIVLDMPSVHVGVDTGSDLADELHDAPVQALRSSLLSAGFPVVDEAGTADLTVQFDLRTEHRAPTGNFEGFHTAYVEGSIKVRNASGQIVEEILLDRTKGVQLNPDAALQLALSNTAESIEKSKGKIVADALR